jgi:hypothetical protein
VTAAGEQLLSARAADTVAAVPGPANRTGAQLLSSFPPRPAAASWPETEASRSAVLDRVLSAPFVLDNAISQRNRRLGVLAVMNWLRTQSGDSWQQRWRASGAEDHPDGAIVGVGRAPMPHLAQAAGADCADAIRPVDWLPCSWARHNPATEMARPAIRAPSPRWPRCADRAGSDCRVSSGH